LRSLGYFSHTTIISRHQTYRQSYTLVLSPSTSSVTPTSSARNTTGTTVSVKSLFANFPVRQASSRSNRQSQLTEIQKITLGIGLTSPVGVTVRTCSGEKLVRIERSGTKVWAKNVLGKGMGWTLSTWTKYEDRDDNVLLTVQSCPTNAPRNVSFICTPPSQKYIDQDVNGRYIHSHSLVDELKPAISKLATRLPSSDAENLTSSILIIRIISPSQSTLSLAQTLNTLFSRISGDEAREFRGGGISLDMPRQMETTIKSAKGVEYSKPATKIISRENVKVSAENPGVEYNRRVLPFISSTDIVWEPCKCNTPECGEPACHHLQTLIPRHQHIKCTSFSMRSAEGSGKTQSIHLSNLSSHTFAPSQRPPPSSSHPNTSSPRKS